MIIATRTLWVTVGQSQKPVEVRLMLPKKGKADWSVAYEIDWPGARLTGQAFGIDAMQAVNLGLKKIGTELYSSIHHENGKLIWKEAGAGYGFPVPNAIKDMLVGDDVWL